MNIVLIRLGVCVIAGLLMSRLAKKVNLPAVTAYLIGGLLLGPYLLGALGVPGLGFASLEDVEGYKIISQVALGFIAFTIGNEFRLASLRAMGSRAIVVGILQAVITTIFVDAALIVLHYIAPSVISLSSAITLGAIAAATAPAATLMVVRQYKADGPLTRLLLLVVAIDDAVGLVLFSVSFGIATALEQGSVSLSAVLLEPLLELLLSVALAAVCGFVLNFLENFFHSGSKRMSLSIGVVILTVGISLTEFDVGGLHFGFSLLLVCMMTGTLFCNICSASEELMNRVESWTAPLNLLFFVLSGAELDLGVLSSPMVLLIGLVYIIFRSAGKIFGAWSSCTLTHCSDNICKHLGITLLPQAGVALGMALTAASLSDGSIVRNIVLFSVLVYELIGPTLTKRSLLAAGEIIPENRASSRAENIPKPPVSLQ